MGRRPLVVYQEILTHIVPSNKSTMADQEEKNRFLCGISRLTGLARAALALGMRNEMKS